MKYSKKIWLAITLITPLIASMVLTPHVSAKNTYGWLDPLDSASCSIKGWAIDPDVLSTSIFVKVFRDGGAVGGVHLRNPDRPDGLFPANLQSNDVNNNPTVQQQFPGISGNHRFNISLSDSSFGLRDGNAHNIRVYAINSFYETSSDVNSELNGSNQTSSITCSQLLIQPIINDMSPRKGPTSGGTRVIITGGNFSASGAAVAFDGVQGTIISRSANSIVVDTPQHSGTGTVAMRITNPDGIFADSPNFQFTYGNPIITQVNPTNGPLGGGTEVAIDGDFFATNPTVTFGGIQGQIISASLNSIRVRTPSRSSAGTVAIRITNPNNAFADSPNFQFTYEASAPPLPPPGNLPPAPAGTTDGPIEITEGETVELWWGTADAWTGNACNAIWYSNGILQFGNWSATRSSANGAYLSYTVPTLPVGQYRFVIQCSGFGGMSNEDSIDVTVVQAPPPPPVDDGGGNENLRQCSDLMDNDGDSYIDFPADPGCVSSIDDDEYNASLPPTSYQCSDSVDNDGDSLVDYPADPGCSAPIDDDENNSAPQPIFQQCSDAIDNDGDNLIDFPSDPGCVAPYDNDELETSSPPEEEGPNDPIIEKFEPNLTVPNPPECEFSATRDKILPNEPASLEWECNENVVRATLMGGEFGSTGIGVISGGAPKIGEKEVSPLGTTTYTLKSWNAEIGGFYDEDIATIEVKPFTPFIKEIIPR